MTDKINKVEANNMNTNKIGSDDGFGNKIAGISEERYESDCGNCHLGEIHTGDMIYLHNKEGCRIATWKVTK